jgi:hypothetical protein
MVGAFAPAQLFQRICSVRFPPAPDEGVEPHIFKDATFDRAAA